MVANFTNWVQQHPDADNEDFARFCLNDLIENLYHFQRLLLQAGVLGNAKVEFGLLVLLLPNFLALVLNSLAARHLSALLERIGFDKSKKIYNKLRGQNKHNLRLPSDNSLEQVFQYALLEAANPANFFRNFKEEESFPIRYAWLAMKGKIRDKVYGKTYLSTTYTGYGLLRKLGESEKKREKVLKSQGYKDATLCNLLLAWECFYQICTPNRQRQIQPTMQQWQAIASQYNLLQKNNSIIGWQTIKAWIDDCCIPAAQSYLDPQVTSIDASNHDSDEQTIDIPDPSPSPNDWLVQKETDRIIWDLKINLDFSKFITKLKIEDQKLLLLRYGFELKQTDVAVEFNWHSSGSPDNSRVSKAENRIFTQLAKEILNWIITERFQMEQPIVIDSKWLKNMEIKSAGETALKNHYYNLIQSIKHEAKIVWHQQLTDRQQILKNWIGNQIKIHFDITLQPNGHATNKISSLLEDLLNTAQY
ncbi:hypothetical protein [Aerosakkonema funiforme]|uniref:hypothetical protein n=1 Tax=Aerosakkonema funiforme TaxID=1246630 RepID=UPI0035BA39D5